MQTQYFLLKSVAKPGGRIIKSDVIQKHTLAKNINLDE